MDGKRKEIIIKEIKYWKNSKLIPERYCDFLLTLYTGGSQEEISGGKTHPFLLRFQMLIPVLLLFIFLIIYFTNFSITMQITIGIILVIAIVLLANRLRANYLYLSYLYLFMAAMILYLLTIQMIMNVYDGNNNAIVLATFIHCAIWLLIGLKWRIHFFTIASIIGVIVLLFFIL